MQNPGRSISDELVEWLVNYRDAGLSFDRETACFITDNGGVLSIVTDDSPGHVEFDFFAIWEAVKKSPSWPQIAFMIHTHPDSLNCMSTIDVNMVKGWCTALDIPILYLVVTTNDLAIYLCRWNKGHGVSIKGLTGDYSCACDGWNYLELIFDVLYGISKSPSAASQSSLNELRDFLNRRKIEF